MTSITMKSVKNKITHGVWMGVDDATRRVIDADLRDHSNRYLRRMAMRIVLDQIKTKIVMSMRERVHLNT